MSTGVHRKSNEFAHPVPVEDLERVVGKYTAIYVKRKEPPGIVAAQTESGLRQIIRAERKELCLRGDLVGGERGAGQLDHRADG